MSQILSYRDLEVWQQGMVLVERSYGLTQSLPAIERFGLALQIRKAAVSVPSNVAEGHSRKRTQAFLNHLSISCGSLAELETLIEAARRLGFLSHVAAADVLAVTGPLRRQLFGLIRSLERHRLSGVATILGLLYCVLSLFSVSVVS